MLAAMIVEISLFRSSYESGCQVKKILPAPLRDAGVVTYIQPTSFLTSFLEGVVGLVALARRSFPRRCPTPVACPNSTGFMKSVAHDAVRFRSYAS